ncbi:hypothetical protein DPEC_G00178620 [Dallia pectoralis]|uniref:Uncharacterized protein n=1 Tax=Dallia pectoralis TaxID=75939 RepID=A0ACC2GFH2_DALPE|nr:hypothetical protein DPEC_G00178620 [Dallia pectoralis]
MKRLGVSDTSRFWHRGSRARPTPGAGSGRSGFGVLRRHGTLHTPTYSTPNRARNRLLTGGAVTRPSTPRGIGSGSRPGTFPSACPAGSWARGLWGHLKS